MRILEKIIHPCLWVFATFGSNKAQRLVESESAENLQKNLETIKKFNIFYSTKRLLAVSACPGVYHSIWTLYHFVHRPFKL